MDYPAWLGRESAKYGSAGDSFIENQHLSFADLLGLRDKKLARKPVSSGVIVHQDAG